MSLTPRRMETLAALRRAVEQAGGAVHYSLVATALRISSWTAYDLLRELEALGLVVRRYAHETAGAGRSRILFAPASPAPAEPSVSDRLLTAFDRFSRVADEAAAATLYLSEPAADAGYHLAFWLGRLSAAGHQARDAAALVLEGGAEPAAKIHTVAAMGLGSVLARLRAARLASRLNEAANAFSQMLQDPSTTPELESLVSAARVLASTPTA